MIIVGVDLGHARTGLAVCDKAELLASPLGVIAQRNWDRLAEQIVEEARRVGAEALVVGLPRNMDGSEGESAQLARAMGQRLAALSGLPVDFLDERGTTLTAHGYLNETNTRGKKRKQVIDAVAATVILESYLVWRKNHPGEEEPHGTL